MSRRYSLSVRTRLTLWYFGAVVVVLLGYSGVVYSLVRASLFDATDRRLRQDLESAEDDLSSLLQVDGPALPAGQADQDRWLLELWVDGALARSWPSLGASPLGLPPPPCHERRMTAMAVTSADGLALRVACREVARDGKTVVLRAARSAERISAQLNEFALPLLVAMPVAALLAAVGGFFLAWRALKPLQQMTDQARSISVARLSERLTAPNPNDELGQLALTFNDMFARLEQSFEQMRRFTADASHELRTPLAAIRTMSEIALTGAKGEQPLREVLSSVLEETDSLRALTEDLLTLSRADAGQLKFEREAVDLSVVAREVAKHLDVLAEDKRQRLTVDSEADPLVRADARLLGRAVINVVDNAIKYSPPDSTIAVHVQRRNDRVELRVVDQGPGIPPEARERVFERFFRLDEARSRQQPGSGLGLAIAKWAVEAHGGTLRVESNQAGGSTFVIELATASAQP